MTHTHLHTFWRIHAESLKEGTWDAESHYCLKIHLLVSCFHVRKWKALNTGRPYCYYFSIQEVYDVSDNGTGFYPQGKEGDIPEEFSIRNSEDTFHFSFHKPSWGSFHLYLCFSIFKVGSLIFTFLCTEARNGYGRDLQTCQFFILSSYFISRCGNSLKDKWDKWGRRIELYRSLTLR